MDHWHHSCFAVDVVKRDRFDWLVDVGEWVRVYSLLGIDQCTLYRIRTGHTCHQLDVMFYDGARLNQWSH